MDDNRGKAYVPVTKPIPTYLPWAMASVGALLFMVNAVNSSSFGVLFKPIAQDFGWSRGNISLAFGIRLVVAAIFSAPMGYWIDRYGARWIAIPCFLFLSGGIAMLSIVRDFWQFMLVQGVLMGIGIAGPYMCLVSIVSKWHNKRRGMALGIVSAGGGIGASVIPPLTAKLLESFDWRETTLVLGLSCIVITIPAIIFMRNPPGGLTRDIGNAEGGQVRSGGTLEVWRTLPRLFKTPSFLKVMMSFFLFFMVIGIMANHFVNYATDSGLSVVVAASMMSVAGICSTFGRLALGTVSDRLGAKGDMVLCFSIGAVSIVLITLNIYALTWIAMALFGLAWGGVGPIVATATGEYFSFKNLATTMGVMMIGINIGAGLGPWLGGVMFDAFGSYFFALLLAAVASALGALIVLRTKTPGHVHETASKVPTIIE